MKGKATAYKADAMQTIVASAMILAIALFPCVVSIMKSTREVLTKR